MVERSLKVLEELRATRVEQAQRALQEAHLQECRAQELMQVTRKALGELELSPPLEPVTSARDLLWLERAERARRLRADQLRQRLRVAEGVHTRACEAVRTAQAELLAVEVERRAAAHLLSRRQAESARIAELRREEEAEDAHRARRS